MCIFSFSFRIIFFETNSIHETVVKKLHNLELTLSYLSSVAERRLVSSPPGGALLDGPGHAAARGAAAARGPPPGRVERPRAAAALGAHGVAGGAAAAAEAAEPPHDQLTLGAQVCTDHLITFVFEKN